MRLNRFLSAAGAASRRHAEDFIRAGRVTVGGETVTDPARDVSPDTDHVEFDGKVLRVSTEKRYFIMNKPVGTIVSRGDTHGRKTVYDLLGREADGVFAVGRLDYDTSGLLLFTDDGDLAHRLTHPSWEVEKVYRATVKGLVGRGAVTAVKKGMMLDDGPASPAEMRILDADRKRSTVELTIHEGRKRQVRRMLAALGHRVITLDRRVFGGIDLAGLKQRYRPLTTAEINSLKRQVGLE